MNREVNRKDFTAINPSSSRTSYFDGKGLGANVSPETKTEFKDVLLLQNQSQNQDYLKKQPVSDSITVSNTQEVKSDYGIDASEVTISTISDRIKANSSDASFTTATLGAAPKDKKTINTPFGVFLLTGFCTIIYGLGIIDSFLKSWLYAVVLLVNLLLILCLLFRNNAIRKLTIVVSIITLAFTIFSMFMVTQMMNDVRNIKNNYQNTINSVEVDGSDTQKKEKLDALNLKIAKAEKQTGKVNGLTYAKLSFTMLGNIIAVVYLSLPRVKLAFVKQKD